MNIKKIFYKFTDKLKYKKLKNKLAADKKLKILKSGFEEKINQISDAVEKQEISFLHSGHLGDVINALPIIKELSKNSKCNLYLQSEKQLEKDALNYKHKGDKIYMTDKMVEMVLPLLQQQDYINEVKKFENQKINVDLDLFRKIPMNFNLDEVRWYFHLTGVHVNLSEQYLFAKPHDSIKNKIVIMRSTRRKNAFINYKFLRDYNNTLFLGLKNEYEDLKLDIPNLEFYDCKNFLEATEIIKSSKFFIGNSSFGFTLAEGLKIPRIMESYPDFPVIYPNGGLGYDVYFQKHFEKICKKLNEKDSNHS